MNDRKELARRRDFAGEHGHMVENALMSYIESMESAQREAQASYDSIKDNPEAIAALERPGSIMTLNGLKYSAQMFGDSVKKARAALDAWREIEEEETDA